MKYIILILLLFLLSFGQATTYNQNVNNVFYPWVNTGDIDTSIGGGLKGDGTNASYVTLYAAGYGVSAFLEGELRTSWQQQANGSEDFQGGTFNAVNTSSPIWVYNRAGFNGKSEKTLCKEWAAAVELGAEFEDVDGDGLYDPNIDKPNLYGDETFFMALNDNRPSSSRTFKGFPLGVNIAMTGFAFKRGDALGDVVYVKYKVTNVSGVDMKKFIFAFLVDPDVGVYSDDRITCDTVYTMPNGKKVDNVGYCYNAENNPDADAVNGIFGIDFFQGPVVDGSPTDTAFVHYGPHGGQYGKNGVQAFPGKRNAKMNSFGYFNQTADGPFGAPTKDSQGLIQARHFFEGGKNKLGKPINPAILGVGGTSSTDPRFLFSGDPFTNTGWLMNTGFDRRFFQATEAFFLPAGESQEIVAGFLYGQPRSSKKDSPVDGFLRARNASLLGQSAFDGNFLVASAPTTPTVIFRELSDGKMEMYIDLLANGTSSYRLNRDAFTPNVWRYYGIQVFQVNNANYKMLASDGTKNASLVTSYTGDESGLTLFTREASGRVYAVMEGGTYHKPDQKRLKIELSKDMFTSAPFIPGKIYHYVIRTITYDSTAAANSNYADGNRLATVVTSDKGFSIEKGSQVNQSLATAVETEGSLNGFFKVNYLVKEDLTGDEYKVDFFTRVVSQEEKLHWRLTNVTQNNVLLDNMSLFFKSDDPIGTGDFPIVEGFQLYIRNTFVGEIAESAGQSFILHDKEVGYATLGQGLTPDAKSKLKELNGIYEVRFVAGKADILENQSVVTTDGDTLFHGTAFINPKTKVPLYVVTHQSNSRSSNYNRTKRSAYTSIPFEVWYLGEDLNDPKDDIQVWIVAGYGRKPDAATVFTLLDPVNFPENIYKPENLGGFYTDSKIIRKTPARCATYWSYRSARGDWFTRFRISDELQPNTGKGKISKLYLAEMAKLMKTVTFSTKKDLYPSSAKRKADLAKAKVVPNPYFGTHGGELNQNNSFVAFTHLGKSMTIRIFTLDGRLVRTLEKNNFDSMLKWDLKNRTGITVAPGMYLAHLEEKGVGERVLKFTVITKEQVVKNF